MLQLAAGEGEKTDPVFYSLLRRKPHSLFRNFSALDIEPCVAFRNLPRESAHENDDDNEYEGSLRLYAPGRSKNQTEL